MHNSHDKRQSGTDNSGVRAYVIIYIQLNVTKRNAHAQGTERRTEWAGGELIDRWGSGNRQVRGGEAGRGAQRRTWR